MNFEELKSTFRKNINFEFQKEDTHSNRGYESVTEQKKFQFKEITSFKLSKKDKFSKSKFGFFSPGSRKKINFQSSNLDNSYKLGEISPLKKRG